MAISDIDPVAAGKASGRARYAAMARHADYYEAVEAVLAPLEREQIGPYLVEQAINLIEAATNGQIEATTALERKQLIEAAKIVHTMGRLELGESTSNSATFDVTERDAQVRRLKARLAELADEDEQGKAGSSST